MNSKSTLFSFPGIRRLSSGVWGTTQMSDAVCRAPKAQVLTVLTPKEQCLLRRMRERLKKLSTYKDQENDRVFRRQYNWLLAERALSLLEILEGKNDSIQIVCGERFVSISPHERESLFNAIARVTEVEMQSLN